MSEHHDNERIRRGLAVLVEEAPLAPDFDDLTTTRVRPISEPKQRPLLVAGLSAAAVLVTFVLGGIWLTQTGGPSEPASDPPVAPTVPAAQTQSTLTDLTPGELPPIVLDAAGWSITYIDYTEGQLADGQLAGEWYAASDVVFRNGEAEAELRMNAGAHADFEALIDDRQRSAPRLADETIWGTVAAIVVEDGSGFVAMWESDAVEYEFVAHDIDEETFRSVLRSLTPTSEEQWRQSLPDEIVTDRAEVVPSYLADMSLPPDFDPTPLGEGPVEHWYPVAADVVGAVTCSWIEHWIDAKETGDTQAVQRAVDAMAGSHDWQVLADMSAFGAYPDVVWEYADAMAGDGTIVAGTITTVEATYEQAFGCGS